MRIGRLWLALACVLGLGAAAWPALASRPMPQQAQGCVVEGRVYAVRGPGLAVFAYTLATTGMDLRPYEGQKVLLEGWLNPGDRFLPYRAWFKVLGPCDPEWLGAIRRQRELRP